VNSSKFRLLAVAALVLGSVATAYACGDEDKSSNTSASVAKAGSSCCASKSSNAVAKASGSENKSASAALASKDGDHCASMKSAGANGCAKGAKNTVASSECTYGASSVTYAGTCPSANEADYSFFVSGAECQGTGTAVAKTIKAMPGVASVTVDYENHMAYVCTNSKTASKKAIQNTLKKAGYSDVKFVSQERDNCAKSHGKIEA
jgi:copper chaperone CopZ